MISFKYIHKPSFWLFLAAYAIYLSIISVDIISESVQRVSGLLSIILMAFAIIWNYRKSDEVIRSMVQQSVFMAFWLLLLLFISFEFFPVFRQSIIQFMPLYALSMTAFLVSYLTNWIRYR